MAPSEPIHGKVRTSGDRLVGRFLRSRRVVLGSMFLLAIALGAVFAGVIAPADPEAVDVNYRLQPPKEGAPAFGKFLLGGDQLGGDILSRIIYGARISLAVGVIAVLLSGSLGMLLGLLAGYYGGRADDISIDPNNLVAYKNKGDEYFQLGKYSEAAADYTSAIIIEPNNSSLYYSRAEARIG